MRFPPAGSAGGTAQPAPSAGRRSGGCGDGFGLGSSNERPGGAAALAVADADELEDRPRAGVAQPRLGQPQHAGVAAGAIGEAGGDVARRGSARPACRPAAARRGGGRPPPGRSPGSTPASARSCRHARHCSLWRSASGSSSSAASRCGRARRAMVMHRSTSGRTSLAFCDRGDDPALDLGLVVVVARRRAR